MRCAFEADEAALQRPLAQRLFHGQIVEPTQQLQALDAQHGFDGERRSTAQRLLRTSGMGRISSGSAAEGTTRFISSGKTSLRVFLGSVSRPNII
jgi:hypothetical protein